MFLSARVSLILFFALFCSSAVLAAQDGRVIADEALIFEAPSKTSPPMVKLHRGDVVRISSRQKSGWYHVILPSPVGQQKFGWLQSLDVEPDTIGKDLRQAGILVGEVVPRQSLRKDFYLNGFFSLAETRVTNFQNWAGAPSKFFLGKSAGGELGYRFGEDWAGLLRFEWFNFSQSFSSSDQDSEIYVKGIFLGVLADYNVIYSRPFRLTLGFGGGAGLGSTIGGSIGTLQMIRGRLTPVLVQSESSSFLLPTGLARLAFRYYLGSDVALGLDAGIRYMFKSNVTVGGSSVKLSVLSPFLGLCFQLEI